MDLKPYLKAMVPRAGDFAGFVQLFFDNLSTIIAIIAAMQLVLTGFYDGTLMNFLNTPGNEQYADEFWGNVSNIIYKLSIPGLAMTMVFGNIYYSIMGARLAVKVGNATALPYGINTPGAFAFIFSIIAPTVVSYGVYSCNSLAVQSPGANCTDGGMIVPSASADEYAHSAGSTRVTKDGVLELFRTSSQVWSQWPWDFVDHM